jgi:hypothetical protein
MIAPPRHITPSAQTALWQAYGFRLNANDWRVLLPDASDTSDTSSGSSLTRARMRARVKDLTEITRQTRQTRQTRSWNAAKRVGGMKNVRVHFVYDRAPPSETYPRFSADLFRHGDVGCARFTMVSKASTKWGSFNAKG